MSIDLALLSLVLLFTVFGFVQGFVRQALSLGTLFGVILGAPVLAHWLKFQSGWSWFQKSPEIGSFVMSAVAIACFFLCIQGLIILIKKGIPVLPGSDRWIGGALGTVKGIVVVLVLGMIFMAIPEKNRTQSASLSREVEDSAFLGMSEGLLEWKALPGARKLREARQTMSEKDLFDKIDLNRDDTRRVPQPWASDANGIDEH